MDGKDMWKLVTGEAESINDYVYTVFGRFGAVRSRDWYYFQNVRGTNKGKGPCLYSVKGDPGQTKNVIRDYPQAAEQMRAQLEKHLKIEIPPLKV